LARTDAPHLLERDDGMAPADRLLAFGIFLLRQYYLSLPSELEEAALIDGVASDKDLWVVQVGIANFRS
jgi:ABC-type glycerol-3-phosphate transport system permease component